MYLMWKASLELGSINITTKQMVEQKQNFNIILSRNYRQKRDKLKLVLPEDNKLDNSKFNKWYYFNLHYFILQYILQFMYYYNYLQVQKYVFDLI